MWVRARAKLKMVAQKTTQCSVSRIVTHISTLAGRWHNSTHIHVGGDRDAGREAGMELWVDAGRQGDRET